MEREIAAQLIFRFQIRATFHGLLPNIETVRIAIHPNAPLQRETNAKQLWFTSSIEVKGLKI